MAGGDERDLEIIRDPLKWPLADYLCMKNYDKSETDTPIVGRLRTGDIRNVWSHPDDGGKLIGDYNNVEEMLLDGWMVD